MTSTRLNDKAITEGYLAGGATLLVTILWIVYPPLSKRIKTKIVYQQGNCQTR